MSDVAVKIDLRHLVPTIARDQGSRPTCLAFAVSDTHSASRGSGIVYSAEHCFYEAHREAGTHPSGGAQLPAMLNVVEVIGQVPEAEWPYLKRLPIDLNSWKPPGLFSDHQRCDSKQLPATLGTVTQYLIDGHSLLLTMRLSDAFYTPASNGVIDQRGMEQPDPQRRHAVVAVGCGAWDTEDAVLVRNSRGTGWGLGGYAWLTAAFLKPRLDSVTQFLGGKHVPSNTSATNAC